MPVAPYPIDQSRLAALVRRYQNQPQPAIGHGTVRDFSDSVELLPE